MTGNTTKSPKKPVATKAKVTVKRVAPKPATKVTIHKPVDEKAEKPVVKTHRMAGSGFVSAVGRRKSAVARVRVQRQGAGVIVINGRPFEQYFATMDFRMPVLQPLELSGLQKDVDVSIKVSGGGKIGQAEAIRLGIARALVLMDESYRKQMRPAGYLTRDSRVKERKKYGLKKARRAPQFSKR